MVDCARCSRADRAPCTAEFFLCRRGSGYHPPQDLLCSNASGRTALARHARPVRGIYAPAARVSRAAAFCARCGSISAPADTPRIGARSRSTASKAAGLEYRRRYCRPDDSYGGRDTEQRFSVLIKNAFENRFIVAERLPVGDQPLVLQQRIISAEHDTVLQPIADLALQGVRIELGRPSVHLRPHIRLVQHDGDHLVLPWPCRTRRNDLEVRILNRELIDIARVR